MNSPLAVAAWRGLHLADALVCDRLNAHLAKEAGCTLNEHDVLAWLSAAPDRRLRMRELACRLHVTQGGLTRIIDRLATRGWVDRDHPPENRREVFVALTTEGARAHRAAQNAYARVLDAVVGSRLNERDMVALRRIAGKLLQTPRGKQDDWCPPPAS